MAKYDPLCDWLATKHAAVSASFEEIAHLVGGLPPIAYKRPEWWENNDDRHVQAAAWLAAGMQIEVLDLGGQTVTFGRREG